MNYSRQWEALLDEIDEFLEDHEDVRDGSDGQPLPNKAMSLLTSLRYLRPTDAQANVARPEEEVASKPAMMGEAMFRDAMRYRWLRADSKVLETEQRKATIVEVYQGKAMDEQIDKAMGTYSEPQQSALKPKATIFNTPSPNIVESRDAAGEQSK